MTTLNRRCFLQLAGATAGAGLAVPQLTLGAQRERPSVIGRDDEVVRLSGDGLGLTPAQYSRLLVRLADEAGISPDSYSLGGVVEQLEERFARVVGKERAIFMPTG